MGLVDTQKPGGHRKIKGKVQVSGADAALERRAKRLRQTASTERQKRFGVREKESSGKLVISSAEFAIPVRRELVVGIPARSADNQRSQGTWRSRERGNQISAWEIAELIALEIKQLENDRIDSSRPRREP